MTDTATVDKGQTFLEQIRLFANAGVKPCTASWSMGESPSDSLFHRASELGITGIEVPCENGGQGHSFGVKALACEELAKVDFGFAMSLINTHNVAKRICISAPSAVRDRYLPALLAGQFSACTALTEPNTGSDLAAIETHASLTADGWVLNGEKSWIVNARHAGLAIVFAQCDEVGSSEGVAAFLVDLSLPGVKRYSIDSGFSQTSIGTGGFTLEQVFIDKEYLLLEKGLAFKSILNEINGARVYVAVMCNAMLGAALQEVRQYGERRHSFGKPLNAYESWRRTVTDAESDWYKSKTMADDAVLLVTGAQDAQLSAINAKITAVETCQQHLPLLLHLMGAEGLRPEYCFTRHLAAAQMAGLTDGATSLLRERAAKLQQKQL